MARSKNGSVGFLRAVSAQLDDAAWHFRFEPVFNGHTFHEFLKQLVAHYGRRKVFLIIDNGACHWLDDEGKRWLAKNQRRIELHRLPPYSPEFNPAEGVWKATSGGFADPDNGRARARGV